MRRVSVSLMAALAMAVFTISCAPERDLFSDATVKEDAETAPVRSEEAR